MVEDRLNDMLLAWQEQQSQGRDVQPAELCRDCPQLIDELARRIQVLRQMNALMQPPKFEPRAASGVVYAPLRSAATGDLQTDVANNDEVGTVRSLASSGPTEIAGYRIVATLDSGGQGIVYRAVHPTLGRDVVIKLGRATVQVDQNVDALMQEGRILAELDDPGMARIYDLFLHEGHACLVMEYVRGRNLGQDARDRPRAPREAAALLARVAHALAKAHRRGVVHCDIKPGNILIDEAGHPRLIDFGIARFADAWRNPAEEGGLSGTVAHMSPEQARGELPTSQSDVFALGGVLYFLLTGKTPFDGANFNELLGKARRCEWDRARLADGKIPAKLRSIAEKALAADPAARHASAEEFAQALETFARPRRRPWLIAAAALLLVAAAAALIVRPYLHKPDQQAEPKSAPVTNMPADEKPRPFAMQVRVWRSNRFLELVDCVPVSTGDEIRIETVAPAGMHAALFVQSSSGNLVRLAASLPGDEDRPFGYPENVNKGSKLTGASGNELILMCARRLGPISAEDARPLLAGFSAWPALPADAVLGLSPTGCKALQKSRDLGPLTDRANPEGEVQKGLEELRRRLRPHFDYFEAIVFSHGD